MTLPQDRTPATNNKNASKHPIIYTSAAIGTKTPQNKRTELKIAIEIHHLIPKLGLPQHMDKTAIHYMRKLRHETKKHNPQKNTLHKKRTHHHIHMDNHKTTRPPPKLR